MGGQESCSLDDVSARKFFISYRRSAENDRLLAQYLKAGLEKAGHEVFIDSEIPVGTKWAAEIGAHIDWCDHFVALLSKKSIASEMVQGEIRMAHQTKRHDGRPIILPIRVNYEGPLDYELDSYLSPIQYVSWADQGDSERILESLLDAATKGELGEAIAFRGGSERKRLDPLRVQPVNDEQALLRIPGGTMRIDDPFYTERSADRIVDVAAKGAGETIVIKAPQQMGKSSLLMRYLSKCKEARKQIVYLDFQSFTAADLGDYSFLLQMIAKSVLHKLDLPKAHVIAIESQMDFQHFLEDQVVARAGGPMTLAFDGVDRLLGQGYQSDFFSMLRTWHNNRANPDSAWAEIDLAFVIATEPYLLIKNEDQSPFNVAVPIELSCFDEDTIAQMNDRYDRPLKEQEDVSELFKLLAGHPQLTRIAFFRLVGEKRTFAYILDNASRTDGPFGDHLRATLILLQQQPDLLDAIKKLAKKKWQPDQDTYYRLHGAGLACRRNDEIEPANNLYASFFAQVE